MIVTIGTAPTAIAQVTPGDIIFNTGAVPVYVDTIQANVITAPQSSATPVNPGASIQWAGTPGLLYGKDPTGSSPGIGVTAHTGLPFPAPVGGPQYLFRSYGLLIYSGPPGQGNLIGSFLAPNAPSVDPFGNPLTLLFALYGAANAKLQLSVAAGLPFISFFSGLANEALPAQIKEGSGGGILQFILAGPTDTTSADAVFIDLQATPHGTPNLAKGFLTYVPPAGGQVQMFSWGGDGVFRRSLAGFVGSVPATQNDSFARTATTIALTPLTVAYSIPANDQPGSTLYHFVIWGHGTGGGNAASMAISFLGVNVFSENFTAVQLPAGHSFIFRYDVDIQVTSTGVAGNANLSGFRSLIDLTAGSSIATGTIEDTRNAVNTTALSSLVMNWQWAAVTGGPTITGDGSKIERIGA